MKLKTHGVGDEGATFMRIRSAIAARQFNTDTAIGLEKVFDFANKGRSEAHVSIALADH